MIRSSASGLLITATNFAAAMAPLGPFEPAPRLAAGVSGGADSMALALLADAWARERGGALLALIVDHGLRKESAAEAAQAAERLAARGIASRVLTVAGLTRGTALAQRAREARFRIMTQACAAEGILHLLFGHHAGDQAETVLMRSLGGSGPIGLAGMAALVEMPSVRILRPLLTIPPFRLRATLDAAGVAWVEDPSNTDPSALRARLRMQRRDRAGVGSATTALVAAVSLSGRYRANDDVAVAAELAMHASLRPEGFGLLHADPDGRQPAMIPRALSALIQTIAGADFPPPTNSILSLAAQPRSATLAGVRLLPAGRLDPGLLLVREAAAMQSPIEALPGVVWDGRFRLGAKAQIPPGTTIGALGADAARLRDNSRLPSAVLQTLPALRRGAMLLAVPHLLYPDAKKCACIPVTLIPPRPVAAAPFLAANAFGDA